MLSSNPIFFTNALKFLLIVPSARMITGMTVTLLQFQIVHILLLIFFHFLLFLFKHSCDKGTSEIYYATRSLLLQFVVPDLAQQSAVLPSLSLCRYLFSTNPMKSGSHFLHPLQKLFVKFLISLSPLHPKCFHQLQLEATFHYSSQHTRINCLLQYSHSPQRLTSLAHSLIFSHRVYRYRSVGEVFC